MSATDLATRYINPATYPPPVQPTHPYVGQPATIHYYTDTRAAVVTRVTAKTITLARVETGPSSPDLRCDEGAYGVRPARSEGILSRPIAGSDQRFTFRHGKWRNGSLTGGLRATLGHSTTWVDYRL